MIIILRKLLFLNIILEFRVFYGDGKVSMGVLVESFRLEDVGGY